ncbi:Solute carrier family 25 member 38-like protein [Lachnellula suecica]|uniref:Mitochondrial glycine transporter n=1 Tax=Lachnellula suecica TaxID=602035 RepID=A0A8T9CFN5_9HELO|nr:Solute carrier family 25 member 38-like protein [Lachnellula suecica]
MSNGRPAGKSSASFHFAAGLSSGVLSAVLLQPADLLKTRVQQQAGHTSLLTTIRTISRSSPSILSFWRGTLPSALRTGFGSAIYFSLLNSLRQHVARSSLLGAVEKHKLHKTYSSSLPSLSNLANLTTGAVARASAGFILMPMTVIKVRYESSLYAYRSIAGAGRDILRTEGLRGFFSGFGATAIRDAPYAGLYVLFYEQLKKRLSVLSTSTEQAGMKGSTSASINFSSGILAAGLATAFTNPFDAIKTRIQLQPREYRNIMQAARRMVGNEGVKSLFDGWD